MTAPAISVLMPVRNVERFIESAVQSILNQSYGDFELIIVDDASDDDTLPIVRGMNDGRIRLVELREWHGIGASRNVALNESTGRYVAIMDGDDIALSERFRHQIDFLQSHLKVDVVGTLGWWIDEHGRRMRRISLPVRSFAIEFELLFDTPLVHSSVMMRSEFLKTAGGYADEAAFASDIELWLRLLGSTKFENLSAQLTEVRQHRTRSTVRYSSTYMPYVDQLRRAALKEFVGCEVSEEEATWWRLAAFAKPLPSADAVYRITRILQNVVELFVSVHRLGDDDSVIVRDRARSRLVWLAYIHADRFPEAAIEQLQAARSIAGAVPAPEP